MQDDVLLQYLKTACAGKKSLRSGKSLQNTFRISGNELRRRIHRLRCWGLPIAANRDGYYYAETAGELYTTIRQLEKLRSGVEAAIRGLEAAMDKFGVSEGSR